MQSNDKTMEFMQIAMKYLPEAQQKLQEAGIELNMDNLQPFFTLFTNVMNEAYELGKADAAKE
ncbi:ComZ family protein [Mesobacillus subterraneus]|uniref:ComZ family protein n=1 Tax=Mesobacillus subterraneus TaxID=285983 RepID=UPI001CFE2B5D|nr:ComZ family protein [Mesobacillus subterraneus]WLR53851.1 ComZ family protein [Mesobacillus subterraneus]